MISDVLAEACIAMERYVETMPTIYAPFLTAIWAVQARMAELRHTLMREAEPQGDKR